MILFVVKYPNLPADAFFCTQRTLFVRVVNLQVWVWDQETKIRNINVTKNVRGVWHGFNLMLVRITRRRSNHSMIQIIE